MSDVILDDSDLAQAAIAGLIIGAATLTVYATAVAAVVTVVRKKVRR